MPGKCPGRSSSGISTRTRTHTHTVEQRVNPGNEFWDIVMFHFQK